jgi:hypothetical protein
VLECPLYNAGKLTVDEANMGIQLMGSSISLGLRRLAIVNED